MFFPTMTCLLDCQKQIINGRIRLSGNSCFQMASCEQHHKLRRSRIHDLAAKWLLATDPSQSCSSSFSSFFSVVVEHKFEVYVRKAKKNSTSTSKYSKTFLFPCEKVSSSFLRFNISIFRVQLLAETSTYELNV